jgi:hypothetical protein
MRFLMNTLLALISTAVDSCVLAKLSLDALGRAAVLVSSAKPGSRHPGLLARHNYSSRSFGTSSIQRFQSSCYGNIRIRNPSLPSSAPHHSRYFSHTLSNVRGRLRPTVE